MTLPQLIGVATGVVTLCMTIVYLTKYIVELQIKIRQGELEGRNSILEERLKDLERKVLEGDAERKILDDKLNESRRTFALAGAAGNAAIITKSQIDSELSQAM